MVGGGEGRVGEVFVGGVEVGKVGRVAMEGQPYGEVGWWGKVWGANGGGFDEP